MNLGGDRRAKEKSIDEKNKREKKQQKQHKNNERIMAKILEQKIKKDTPIKENPLLILVVNIAPQLHFTSFQTLSGTTNQILYSSPERDFFCLYKKNRRGGKRVKSKGEISMMAKVLKFSTLFYCLAVWVGWDLCPVNEMVFMNEMVLTILALPIVAYYAMRPKRFTHWVRRHCRNLLGKYDLEQD